MKVVHVITRLTLGGSAENTVSTIVGLNRAGFECVLAVGTRESERPLLEDARRRGCAVVDVPGLRREVRPDSDLAALVQIRRVLVRERARIVHTHTSKAGFIGRLAARLTAVPAIIHQPHGHIFYGYYGPRRSAVYASLERLAARWTDRIVTLTETGTEEHLARGIGRRDQFVAVPSGVPTDEIRGRAPTRAEARARLGIGSAAYVIAGLGRFVSVKGFDLLVAALPRLVAEVPSTHLVLIGDGPERAALERQAQALGVAARLHVTGATTDVPVHLAAADVFAAPSRNEGMGRALVEAMALGLPVVGAAVGGIPSVVTDGGCGCLVPPDDVPALATALAALGRDPMLRVKLGEAAVAQAEEFSTAVAHARMLAVYRGLVAEKRLP